MRDWQHVLANVVELHKRGPTWHGRCPMHSEKTASFHVYADGHYHCYGCGAHGWCDALLGRKPERKPLYIPPPKQWPAIDWRSCVENALKTSVAGRLARWRGYPGRFCHRLIDAGHVGAVDGCIAFPIRQGGRIVRAHVRRHEDTDWKARGDSPFFYWPSVGASVDAMIIGEDYGTAHLFESQWDLFAAMCGLKTLALWIATRGSANAAKLGKIRFSQRVVLWPQNDEAGEKWSVAVRKYIPRRSIVSECRMPDGVKDANDFLRAGGDFLALNDQ